MKNLVKDASMGPLREALKQGIEITKLKKEDMRAVTVEVKISLSTAHRVCCFLRFIFLCLINMFVFLGLRECIARGKALCLVERAWYV